MGIKFTSLVVVLVIVVLLFGTHRLRNLGEDLAAAVKSFRKGIKEDKQDFND